MAHNMGRLQPGKPTAGWLEPGRYILPTTKAPATLPCSPAAHWEFWDVLVPLPLLILLVSACLCLALVVALLYWRGRARERRELNGPDSGPALQEGRDMKGSQLLCLDSSPAILRGEAAAWP